MELTSLSWRRAISRDVTGYVSLSHKGVSKWLTGMSNIAINSDLDPYMRAQMSTNDDIETRRKRALYRAQHRGTQEMDILIGGYVADHLSKLDSSMLDRLEALMDNEETDLQAWLMGQRDVPEKADHDLIARIRDHKIAQARS